MRIAIKQGHKEMVELLLDKGADTAAKDTAGMTMLHIIAMSDHIGLAELLIKEGADVNVRDKSDFTPLDYAQGNNKEMVELLKKHGGECTVCQ